MNDSGQQAQQFIGPNQQKQQSVHGPIAGKQHGQSQNSIYTTEYGMLGIDVSSHVCDHRMNSEENTLVFKIKYDKRPNGFSPASTWEKKEDLLKLAPAIYANYLDMHLEYAILD